MISRARAKDSNAGVLWALALAGALTAGCVGGDPRERSVTVSVEPAAAVVAPAGTASFTAIVTGTASHAVTWSVSDPNGGAVDATGKYTAPPEMGTFHVVATSAANPTRSGTAVVTVAIDVPSVQSASTQGPYLVQSYTSGIPLGANYVNPTIYHPADATSPFPGVVFVPGNCETYQTRTTQPQNFTQWGTLLASHGLIVMFIDTGVDGCPGARSTALEQGLATLVGENTRAGSPLAGKVDTSRLAVMGHSFGGSGALYVGEPPKAAGLRAVIGLTPVTTDGYYPTDEVPSLIIAGQGDPYTSDSQAQYDSIPSTTPKVHALFSPVSTVWRSMHHVADTPLGTNVTDPVVARIGLSFLEVYLVGDDRYRQFLVSDPSMAAFAWNP